MFLKSLEIQGFKSFPDKTLLTFHKGVTAVVGPNGSGKSNLSDAIRWVLGEMSAKTLRGGRMEDVIFGGTVNRRPLGFAEVSLTIDNGDRSLALDSGEVTVTRRYYRSGESEYLLNRKEVRLRDVYELFMDTGLGRDGYSVIGQGRIAEIVSAKSEDRRQIFEEAAGISKYRYRKEESERRLAAAEENLVRLRDILAELEGRIGPLREQAGKARQYVALAQEKKTCEVGLWLGSLDKRREELRRQDSLLEGAQAQYGEVEAKQEAAQKAIEDAYLEQNKAAAQADSLRTRAQASEETAVQDEAKAAIARNDIKRNLESIERLEDDIRKIRGEGQAAAERFRQLRENLEQRRADTQTILLRTQQCESEALALQKQGEDAAEKMDEAAAELSQLNTRMADLKLEKNSAESSILHINERRAAIDEDSQTRGDKLGEAKDSLAKCGDRIVKTQEKADLLRNELAGYTLKLEARHEKVRKLDDRSRALSLQISGLTQRGALLADMEKRMEGFSRSVKAVMRDHARGLLSGIHGPVSRIVKVEPRYAVAVETALGAAAQHIVVDTEEDAKAAIAMLKRGDEGRATFLPISIIHGNELGQRGIERCAGYIGLASSLVKYDPKYGEIVKNLLGRTAVARDLDCAVSMARQFGYHFRIVTLDGQVVNAGGSLTGGSASRNAGLLSRAGEIAAIKKQASELQNELAALRQTEKAENERLGALQAAASGVEGELATAKEDIIRLEGENKRLSEQVQTLSLDLAALEKEKSACAQRVEGLKSAADAAAEKISRLEEQAAGVRKRMERLSSGKNELAGKRDEQAEKLTGLRLEKLACEKDIAAVKQTLSELERRKQEQSGQIARLGLEKQGLLKQNAEFEQNAQSLEGHAAGLRQQAAELRKKAGETAGTREEIEKETTRLRADERSLSDEKEKLSGELARLSERKASIQAEYDSVISRLWEEYELTRSQAEEETPRIAHPEEAKKRLSEIKKQIKDLGEVNVGAIDEYREVSQRYEFMKTQTDDVEKSKSELNALINGLTDRMRTLFAEQFKKINANFSSTFVELFGGGQARLELTQPDDVLSSGIEIIVQPPGKIIKNLSALSGGEQAFVAIALYFAILKVRPSPFCVLDEIEAALDDSNVSRFSAYLKRMSDRTQFIVITHRRGTMDGADVLYGVTMQEEGVSKLLTLDVDELAQKLGIA